MQCVWLLPMWPARLFCLPLPCSWEAKTATARLAPVHRVGHNALFYSAGFMWELALVDLGLPFNYNLFSEVTWACVCLQAQEQSCWTLSLLNHNSPASWEITSTSTLHLEAVTCPTCMVWSRRIMHCKETNCRQSMGRSSRLIFQPVLL